MLPTCLSLLLALAGLPQDPSPGGRAALAEPVRLMDPSGPVGKGRLYPSPAFHDVDGDGVAELVLGDLLGALTMSARTSGAMPGWGEARPLKRADGEDLKFSNW